MLGEDTKYDFTRDQKKGYFFCFPLPTGNYKFYGLSYYNFAGGGSGYSTQNDHRFSLPFSVVSSQVTNLGAITMTTSEGKNFLGLSVFGPGQLELSKISDSGITSALLKCPETKDRTIVDATLSSELGGNTPEVRYVAPSAEKPPNK